MIENPPPPQDFVVAVPRVYPICVGEHVENVGSPPTQLIPVGTSAPQPTALSGALGHRPSEGALALHTPFTSVPELDMPHELVAVHATEQFFVPA